MARNTSIIKNLIQTLQREVKPDKLYDALDRINNDLTAVFDAVFTGPLPAVSGENLDLSKVPKDKFPPNVAYTDQDNDFSEPQTIEAVLAGLILKNKLDSTTDAGTKWGRALMPADGQIIFSVNLDWDGTDYAIDDGSFAAGLVIDDGDISLVQFDGADPINIIGADIDSIVRLSNPEFWTDADPNEIVIPNNKQIRGCNAAGDATIAMMILSTDGLIGLGYDADVDGSGHVAIPTVDTVDMPTAGATQNGTIVVDKTLNRLVYYSSGNRYKIAIGTAF